MIPHPHAAAERRSQARDLNTVDDVLALVKKALDLIDDDFPQLDGRTASELMSIHNKLDEAGGMLRKLKEEVETR